MPRLRDFPTDRSADDHILGYFAKHRLFGGLPDAVLQELLVEVSERSYLKGHNICYAGDPLGCLYIIQSGIVVTIDTDARGNRRAPLTFWPGDILGLIAATLDDRLNWTATAVTDVRVLLIPISTFSSLCARSYELTREVARELARTLRRAERATVRLIQIPVTSRLALFLLENSTNYRASDQGPIAVDLTFSHQDLSLLLGTSRESISRAFTHLSRAGLISARGQRVVILKPEALRAVAEG